MNTKLGKILKMLRIERSERLMDMAQKLGRSATSLSSIEAGRKAAPLELVDQLVSLYNLTGVKARELEQAIIETRREFSLRPESEVGRDTAAMLARRANDLTEDEWEQIRNVLKEHN